MDRRGSNSKHTEEREGENKKKKTKAQRGSRKKRISSCSCFSLKRTKERL